MHVRSEPLSTEPEPIFALGEKVRPALQQTGGYPPFFFSPLFSVLSLQSAIRKEGLFAAARQFVMTKNLEAVC